MKHDSQAKLRIYCGDRDRGCGGELTPADLENGACTQCGEPLEVAVVGRPVARMLQNGFTAELTRVCIVEDLETVKDREVQSRQHDLPLSDPSQLD